MLTAKRIEKLRAKNLPRVIWSDLFHPDEGTPPPSEADQKAMNDYFAGFTPWQTDAEGKSLCLGCQKRVLGGIEAALLAGGPGNTRLEWKIAHGESYCISCGWPSRQLHYDIGGKEDPLIKRLSFGLQYHPDVVGDNPRKPAA